MSKVSSLGYVIFGVSDIERWIHYLTETLGLEYADRSSCGDYLFRMDESFFRIAIRSGPDDLVAAGWETQTPDDLDRVVQQLKSLGANVSVGDEQACKARGVCKLYTTQDPSGLQLELFYGAKKVHEKPFRPATRITGFKANNTLGMGHIALSSTDIKRDVEFYRSALGLKISDYIHIPVVDNDVTFLHCNQRHHSLALAPVSAPKRLLHFMLELQSLDDVMSTYYAAKNSGIPITNEIGRHVNDHMVSFYSQTPSGFEVEYGWGGREIDPDAWSVERHDRPSIWGHPALEVIG